MRVVARRRRALRVEPQVAQAHWGAWLRLLSPRLALRKQLLVVNIDRHAAAEVFHVILPEVEASVLGVEVGSLAHEHATVPRVGLPGRIVLTRHPHMMSPAVVVPGGFLLGGVVFVLDVTAQVGKYASVFGSQVLTSMLVLATLIDSKYSKRF